MRDVCEKKNIIEEEQEGLSAKSKSERNVVDSQATIGQGCTRETERVLASFGKLTEVLPEFSSNVDVKSAGVLLALPSLLLTGLLRHCKEYFCIPKGYYGLETLLITLCFCALLRIKSLEGVRYCDPGELGKLVGLDRIPEVKTLRKKVEWISEQGRVSEWSKELGRSWLEDDPDLAGTLYVDGHVRVYNGKKTKLPRRFVSRQRLCLRGVTDYWINDVLGRPFFVVNQSVNSGLISVLREKIVPELLCDVPNQPSEEELSKNPYLYRFGIVFDREGYSPAFFKELWNDRIVCYTYRKYAQEEWSGSEFKETESVFANGETVRIKLAERGVYFKSQKIWFREIRKLTDSGHQTALLTTDYINSTPEIACKMFSRWSQENFIKYMMEHYGIDRLVEYKTEEIDDSILVVNPRYRELESRHRSKAAKLYRRRAEYAELTLKSGIEEKDIQQYVKRKSELKELIESLQEEIEALKSCKKDTEKHILFSELEESDKFKNLKRSGKQFMDTIKMIAYRAETAMVNILRSYILKKDEARSIIRQIFLTDADIEPDKENGILRVMIHNMTNPRNNQYVQKLCETLNESETVFPGTNLRLVYNLVSN